MTCRHCGADVKLLLIDLGSAPPSNALLTEAGLRGPEVWLPLRVLVCQRCWLVQTEDVAPADQLFSADYTYFSAFSSGWLAHSERYVSDMVSRFALDANSHVVEVAANDGYLLQYVKARGIPCTGIEPTAITAAATTPRAKVGNSSSRSSETSRTAPSMMNPLIPRACIPRLMLPPSMA